MRIGELAAELGVSPKALRFYEERGVLPPARRGANRYREFGPEDVARVRVLIGLRRLDVPLDEAAELASLCAAGECQRVAEELRGLIAERRGQIARRSVELQALDVELARLDDALGSGAPPRSLISIARKEEQHV
jgi:MerR family copper efflux transcriptional regulator